jgi:hypothetical protein
VWDGAEKLGENLRIDGAASVKFAILPRTGKEGLNDLLAKRPANKRADTLARLIGSADVKLPRRPAKGAGKTTTGFRFFDSDGRPACPMPHCTRCGTAQPRP